jgi:hypothetical protein
VANLTKTLKTQSINSLGPSPSTKWNSSFNWTATGVGPGNGTWGLKSAGSFGSLPLVKSVFVLWSGSNRVPVTGFTNLSKRQNKLFNKTVTATYAITDKEQTDGHGYNYIYADRTTNSEHQFIPSYTSSTAGTVASYTCALVTPTTWS